MPESRAKEPVAYPANDSELRALRDRVFGVPLTDNEWQSCKKNWTRPDSVEWLREKSKRTIVI